MISSQILLTGFMAYWLASQYRLERQHLHLRLSDLYAKTHEQLIDTLVLNHLVIPSLNDSLLVELNISDERNIHFRNDTGSQGMRLRAIRSDSAFVPDGFAFDFKTLEDLDSSRRDSMHLTSESEQDMLVRTVKLFISQTDESFRDHPSAHVFAMQVDTALFIEQFKKSIEGWWPHFVIHPDQQGPRVPGRGIPRNLLIKEKDGPELPGIRVEHYRAYLLRLILPQFLFVMVLLGLSASALLFAFRNFRKQLLMNQLRDDFIANISHELKTPVSTVKIALEALGTFDLKNDPEKAVEYLEMATRETDRLEKLVSRVLQHEVMQKAKGALHKEPVDLVKIALSALRTFDIQARETGAVIKTEIPEHAVMIMADPIYLEGVISNMIDNSLKYGGPDPEIQLLISTGPSGPRISVRDRGPGIPNEYKEYIFERFFRIPSGDQHNVKGYGLGLSFAKHVMGQHNGSITFRNLPQRGCEFTLQFPLEAF